VKEPSQEFDALVQVGAIAPTELLADIRTLIASSRSRAAQAINAELVLLYWHIGRRIRSEILGEGRAEYGERIVKSLSDALTLEHGKGFSRRNIFRMVRFAEVFPDEQIVSTLSAQLSWSHFLEIIPFNACYSAISTLKCAVLSVGVYELYETKFAVCYTNAQRSLVNQKSWLTTWNNNL